MALPSLAGVDALGWIVSTSVWTDPGSALAPVSKAFAGLSGAVSLLLTYLVLLIVLSAGAYALGEDVRRFAIAFTVVFAIAYASWFIGGWARLAAVTPADQAKYGLSWSLRLTSEGGFIVALLAGLAIANSSPRFAEWLRAAIRPELYIKVAIVIPGAFIAVTAAGKLSLASSLLLRGVAAIVEAYLIYWPIVDLIARKGFGFSREWSAPLHRHKTLSGEPFQMPTAKAIDARLVGGSLLFGVGSGLVGLCPGPAIVDIGFLDARAALFVACMAAGMALYAALAAVPAAPSVEFAPDDR